ncbi:unnamed protein product [Peniophora sp. CBMAI 1063]|nr:unnamed protein product [Peniophora sp. CBMAI 1063]
MSLEPVVFLSSLSRHAHIWLDLFAHILSIDFNALPSASSGGLPRRSASCMATMNRQSSSSTTPAQLARSLRRALSVGHSRDARQPPSRSTSVHFVESPSAPPSAYDRRASLISPRPSSSRPSMHHRSVSVGSVAGSTLSRKRNFRRAFASPALSPSLPETPLESPGAMSPVPSPSVVGAVAERNVVVVNAGEQAAEMHAQIGVWEEQPPSPHWAAYEHAVASVGVWEHESVGGPQKDPFATAAPSYIAHSRPTGERRELAVNTLVSSNTAYMMASAAGSLDSDSATLVANSPVSASSPRDKRASIVSVVPSTKAKFTSRLQRAMRKLRGVSVTTS